MFMSWLDIGFDGVWIVLIVWCLCDNFKAYQNRIGFTSTASYWILTVILYGLLAWIVGSYIVGFLYAAPEVESNTLRRNAISILNTKIVVDVAKNEQENTKGRDTIYCRGMSGRKSGGESLKSGRNGASNLKKRRMYYPCGWGIVAHTGNLA